MDPLATLRGSPASKGQRGAQFENPWQILLTRLTRFQSERLSLILPVSLHADILAVCKQWAFLSVRMLWMKHEEVVGVDVIRVCLQKFKRLSPTLHRRGVLSRCHPLFYEYRETLNVFELNIIYHRLSTHTHAHTHQSVFLPSDTLHASAVYMSRDFGLQNLIKATVDLPMYCSQNSPLTSTSTYGAHL